MTGLYRACAIAAVALAVAGSRDVDHVIDR
jgi:hypothetical protein